MRQKIAITLDEELVKFLDSVANNRSEYINTLLAHHRQQVLEAQIIAALNEDATDPDYQQEIADWDNVVADGLENNAEW